MIEQARVRPERSWRVKSKPLIRIDLRESCVLLNTSRNSTSSYTNGVLLTPIDGSTGTSHKYRLSAKVIDKPTETACPHLACPLVGDKSK